MKKLSFLLLAGLSVLLSGCFNIFEEVTVKQDGSGTYSLKMDMSAILADEFMKGMLMQSAEENEATKGLAENLEKDTTMYMKDLPLEVRQKTGRPDFWKNVQMRVKISDTSDEFYTDIRLVFKNTSDIDFFYQNLGTVMAESGGETPGLNPAEMLPGGASFKFGKKMLTRLPSPDTKSDTDNEDMEMMKMFLSGANFTSIYNLPGRVKKSTIPDAKVSGNTVTVVTSLLDMMEGKGKIDGDIKF